MNIALKHLHDHQERVIESNPPEQTYCEVCGSLDAKGPTHQTKWGHLIHFCSDAHHEEFMVDWGVR